MQKKRPAIGAAFSHARKVEAKTGGGQKKQHEIAARYLKKKKMPAMQKAMPGTLGAYQSAIAQSSAPGHLSDDDKYAMSRYAALFDRNHQAMAQARAEYFARMLAQRSR